MLSRRVRSSLSARVGLLQAKTVVRNIPTLSRLQIISRSTPASSHRAPTCPSRFANLNFAYHLAAGNNLLASHRGTVTTPVILFTNTTMTNRSRWSKPSDYTRTIQRGQQKDPFLVTGCLSWTIAMVEVPDAAVPWLPWRCIEWVLWQDLIHWNS